MFNIGAKIKESLGNIVVKDIKGTLSLRPKLWKLKVSNGNLLKIGKLILTQLSFLVYIY